MANTTLHPYDGTSGRPDEVDQEGLTRREIKWIPLVVPLAALTMALCALVVLSLA